MAEFVKDMPPKAKKFPEQLVTLSDAEAVSEVVLRFTTDEIPDVDLPPACEQAKKAWLSTFHKNVMRKFREGCVDDSEVPLDAVEDGGIAKMTEMLHLLNLIYPTNQSLSYCHRCGGVEETRNTQCACKGPRRKSSSSKGRGAF